MRRSSFTCLLGLILALLIMPRAARAQDHAIHPDQLETYAKAYVEISKLRDQFHAEAAEARNKKAEAVELLQAKLRDDVAAVLTANGLTRQQYNQITYVLSTDAESRRAFDKIMGIEPPPPLPAAAAAAAAEGAVAANPHLGHIMNAFTGTADGNGLLPTALAEARIVAQHAGLAARNTSDLDAMKLHIGHVIHAIDPAEAESGPGAGYGLKKAAAAIAQHIDLAARAQGASENILTHAVHIATAARNTADRADQVLALAMQIQAATTASEAADLVAKLNTLAGQITAGVDADGDGRIGWQEGEGGLQHIEQHLKLLAQGEKK
jgi:hypothetical protein